MRGYRYPISLEFDSLDSLPAVSYGAVGFGICEGIPIIKYHNNSVVQLVHANGENNQTLRYKGSKWEATNKFQISDSQVIVNLGTNDDFLVKGGNDVLLEINNQSDLKGIFLGSATIPTTVRNLATTSSGNRQVGVNPSGQLISLGLTVNIPELRHGEMIVGASNDEGLSALPTAVSYTIAGTYSLEQIIGYEDEYIVEDTSWQFAAWQRQGTNRLSTNRYLGIGVTTGDNGTMLHLTPGTTEANYADYGIRVVNYKNTGLTITSNYRGSRWLHLETNFNNSATTSIDSPILIKRSIAGTHSVFSSPLINIIDNFTNNGTKNGGFIDVTVDGRSILGINPRLDNSASGDNIWFDTTKFRHLADNLLTVRNNGDAEFVIKGNGFIKTGKANQLFAVQEAKSGASGTPDHHIVINVGDATYRIPAVKQ
jgi:hypothetical protein